MAGVDAQKVERLRQVDLFRRCAAKDLEAVAAIAEEQVLEAGTVLCDQGRVADECFVVLEGDADVSVGGERVGHVGAGETVGEMGLLDHLPRSATVVARSDMRVYRIDGKQFDQVLDSSAIARGLLEQLSRRIRDLETGRTRFASS